MVVRSSTQLRWEGYESLITKLWSFIPTPLTESEISDLDIRGEHGQSQSLLVLLCEELRRHNAALMTIHTSLQMLLDYFKGKTPFLAEIGHLIMNIAQNEIPLQWQGVFTLTYIPTDGDMQLMPVLKLLKSRMEFYMTSLQSGMLPSTFSLLWFSNPSDLLSRVAHSFAQQSQLGGERIILQAKVN